MELYQTKLNATFWCYPHEADALVDLSSLLVGFKTNGLANPGGGATFYFSPKQNLLNVVKLGDWVVFYSDTGERGNEWVFFGVCQTMHRSIVTMPVTGVTRTVYIMTCIDFGTALARSEIYFHPGLAARSEVNYPSDMAIQGTPSGLGVALSPNLFLEGNPGDLVAQCWGLLLGFSDQWLAPASASRVRVDKARRFDLINLFWQNANDVRSDIADSDVITVEPENIPSTPGTPEFDRFVAQVVAEVGDPDKVAGTSPRDGYGPERFLSLLQLLVRRARNTPTTLADLVSLDFIETECLPGYTHDVTPITGVETLWRLLLNVSNTPHNEMFFDLRAVAHKAEVGTVTLGSGASTSARSNFRLGINTGAVDVDAFGGNAAGGVRYVPALVLREQPLASVAGWESDALFLGTKDEVGSLPFGPLFHRSTGDTPPFSDARGTLDRIYHRYEAPLAPSTRKYTGQPVSHLDVVTVKRSEIANDMTGRTAGNIVNCVTVFGLTQLGGVELNKFLFPNFMPITNNVSVNRHGLHTKELQTRFESLSFANDAIGELDSRRALLRWALRWEHMNQHNNEFWGGVRRLRYRPDIRVAYRIDFREDDDGDNDERAYCEGVEHSGEFTDRWLAYTEVTLTNGQSSASPPLYVPPMLASQSTTNPRSVTFSGGGNRYASGRLGRTAQIRDSGNEVGPDRRDVEDDLYAGVGETIAPDTSASDDPSPGGK